jgi:hypothetical protein
MTGGFYPPVIFEVTANATEALATFGKVNTSMKAMEAQAAKTGVAMTNMTRTTVLASAALKGTAIAVLGFTALAVKEFSALQLAMTQLGQAMSNAGVSTAENRKQVQELLVKYEQLGFDAANTGQAYKTLVTATQDTTKANHLLGLSLDLARAKHMSVEDAAVALARANTGNARLFTQFGISLDTTKPKVERTAEAMAKLEARLKGQAEAYTKTLPGQLDILVVKIQNLAEAFGSIVVPALNKFLTALQNTFNWIGKNATYINVLIGTILALSVATKAYAVILVVVNAIQKIQIALNLAAKEGIKGLAAAQLLLNAAMEKNKVMLIVAGIAALVTAYVYAFNHSEKVREATVYLGKGFINLAKIAVEVAGTIFNAFALIVRGTANAQIALGKITNNKTMQAEGKKTLDWIDSSNAKIKSFITDIDKANASFSKLKDAQIKFSFHLPNLAFDIPDFGNTVTEVTNAVTALSDALLTARQKVADFNTALKQTNADLKDVWQQIVGKDFAAAIQEGLLNPVDKLVVSAQKAVNAYQDASNQYEAALNKLTSAQTAYTNAVENGNKEQLLTAESILKQAEDAVNGLASTMQKQLADVQKLQEDMISAIVDAYNQISTLETQRTDILAQATLDRLDLEKSYNKQVADYRKQYAKDVANAQADAAKQSAAIVKQSVDQLRGIYQTATGKSIGDIFSGLTFGGLYAKGGTTQKILAALGLQTSKAKTLANDAASLAGLGFSQTFIEQVVAQGPDVGHQLAQTIITSTPESINQMKAYWEALQQQSSHGVDAIAAKLNTGIVLATEELTAQLKQVGLDLNAQLVAYQQTLTESLASAFVDYSDALDKINIATAKQVAAIDAQITALQAKIAQLQYALSQLATISAPGVVATAPVLTAPTPVIVPLVPKEPDPALVAALKEVLSHTDKDTKDSASPTTNTTTVSKIPTYMKGSGQGAGSGEGQVPYFVINATTNASAQNIADDVAWAIRTSGDVQYRTSTGMSMQ